MDAVEFLKTLRRMCNGWCRECEYGKRSGSDPCMIWQRAHPEEAVEIAEKWAKEHPAKTRQSVFLEQYPETRLMQDGTIKICPSAVSAAYREKDGMCAIFRSGSCAECQKAFWLAEVEGNG